MTITKQVETTAPAMTTAEKAQAFVIIKTLVDALGDDMKSVREVLTDELVDAYVAEGIKQRAVTLPNGKKVAQVTVSDAQPKTTITNASELLAWATENAPAAVETIEHPATEAWTETVLTKDAAQSLLAEADIDPETGALISADGEIIPGIVHDETPRPSKFSVTYSRATKTAVGGREAIFEALGSGDLTMESARDAVQAIGQGRLDALAAKNSARS